MKEEASDAQNSHSPLSNSSIMEAPAQPINGHHSYTNQVTLLPITSKTVNSAPSSDTLYCVMSSPATTATLLHHSDKKLMIIKSEQPTERESDKCHTIMVNQQVGGGHYITTPKTIVQPSLQQFQQQNINSNLIRKLPIKQEIPFKFDTNEVSYFKLFSKVPYATKTQIFTTASFTPFCRKFEYRAYKKV